MLVNIEDFTGGPKISILNESTVDSICEEVQLIDIGKDNLTTALNIVFYIDRNRTLVSDNKHLMVGASMARGRVTGCLDITI